MFSKFFRKAKKSVDQDKSLQKSSGLKLHEEQSIIYHAGSSPGSVRKIIPKKFMGHLISAYCFENDEIRSFRLDKIEIPKAGSKPPAYEPGRAHEAGVMLDTEDLRPKIKPEIDQLESLGWAVTYDKDFVELRKSHKRTGKPLKHPLVALWWDESSASNRWIVIGPTVTATRGFKEQSKPLAIFFKQALEHAPQGASQAG